MNDIERGRVHSSAATDIKKKALELGFTSCGIIPAEPFTRNTPSLRTFLRWTSIPMQMCSIRVFGTSAATACGCGSATP